MLKLNRASLTSAWVVATLLGFALSVAPFALMYCEAQQPGALGMAWLPSDLPLPGWLVKGLILGAPAMALSIGLALLRKRICEELRYFS